VFRDEFLPGHGQRGQIIHVSGSQACGGIKLAIGLIGVFFLLQLQGFGKGGLGSL
jgi:hypothetical protein